MILYLLVLIFLLIYADSFSQTRIYVNYRKADCTGVAPAKCLQIKYDNESKWQNHFGGIGGFSYEEGYEYEILVEEEFIENPPADGSSKKYILKEILSKKHPVVKLRIANRYT